MGVALTGRMLCCREGAIWVLAVLLQGTLTAGDATTTCSSWSLSAAPPEMRHRSSSASAVTKLGAYMFGGTRQGDSGASVAMNDLWWNSQESGWQEVTPNSANPLSRYDHSLSASGSDCLLLYGGTDGNGTVLSDLWKWCESSNAWTLLNATSAPGPLTGHTAIVSAGGIVVFGGTNGRREDSAIWLLDTTSLNWSRQNTTNSGPSARQQHSATMMHSETTGAAVMVVYGGCAGSACLDDCSTAAFGDVWELDLGSWSWKQLWRTPVGQSPEGPSSRYGHSALSWEAGQLAIVAGSNCIDTSKSLLEVANAPAVELWFFALDSLTWRLSTNSQCVGPVATGLIRPFFEYDGTAAIMFGNEQVYERNPTGGPNLPAIWSITLQPAECPPQCSDRGVCMRAGDTQDFLECECYPYGDTDGTSCTDNKLPDFQWYLLYSAFGVTVLLLCFLLRRMYGCMHRRNNRLNWDDEPGLLDSSPMGSRQEVWTADDLDEFIGKEQPTAPCKLFDCDICMDQTAALQLLPCQHTICDSCSCRILASRLECPFCRGEVSAARRMTQRLEDVKLEGDESGICESNESQAHDASEDDENALLTEPAEPE